MLQTHRAPVAFRSTTICEVWSKINIVNLIWPNDGNQSKQKPKCWGVFTWNDLTRSHTSSDGQLAGRGHSTGWSVIVPPSRRRKLVIRLEYDERLDRKICCPTGRRVLHGLFWSLLSILAPMIRLLHVMQHLA